MTFDLFSLQDPYTRLFKETTIFPQRFITAVETRHPEFVPNLARAFWLRFWGHDQPIYRPEDALIVCLLEEIVFRWQKKSV